MLTREQIKAARALLDWSQRELAEKCGDVSEPTIKLVETGRVNSTPATLGAIRDCFEAAGVEFLPQSGVRFRDDLLTVLEPKGKTDNVYVRLMEEVHHTVRGRYGEVLFSFIDQSLSSQEVVDRQLLIRKAGVGMRFLIRHGDTYVRYPLDEYRYLPKGKFVNNSTVVFGDKVAFVINRLDKIIIIRDPDVAEIKKMEFDMLWQAGGKPQKSTAPRRYE